MNRDLEAWNWYVITLLHSIGEASARATQRAGEQTQPLDKGATRSHCKFWGQAGGLRPFFVVICYSLWERMCLWPQIVSEGRSE